MFLSLNPKTCTIRKGFRYFLQIDKIFLERQMYFYLGKVLGQLTLLLGSIFYIFILTLVRTFLIKI